MRLLTSIFVWISVLSVFQSEGLASELRTEPGSVSTTNIETGLKDASISNPEQDAAQRIASSLDLGAESKTVDIELKFRLTKDGDAFDIRLTKGFSDSPRAIQGAYFAVLLAMPYKTPPELKVGKGMGTCSIVKNSDAPVVKVALVEVNDQIHDPRVLLEKVPYADKKYSNDLVVRNWMEKRLKDLAECLFSCPDSPEVMLQLEQSFSQLGLDAHNAHDWLSFSRTLAPQILIMRHPSSEAINTSNGKIAACFEAWRLSHDRSVLSELCDAYMYKAACDTLGESKADPLLLGTAALLADQFSEARKQYAAAEKRGQVLAKSYRERMTGITSGAKGSATPEGLRPQGEQNDWERIIRWFPVDVETVLAARGPITVDPPPDPQKPDYGSFSLVRQLSKIATAIPDDKGDIANLLSGKRIATAMNASRCFGSPRGIGGGSYQGANVIVFERSSMQVTSQLMDLLRKKCVFVERIEDTETLCLDQSRSISYVCSPMEGVLITAPDKQFLREVLRRLTTEPSDRALPASLVEWKQVDLDADVWAIRHYDKSHAPFDRTALIQDVVPGTIVEDWGLTREENPKGLTFYAKSDGTICLKLFSGSQRTLDFRAKYWNSILSQRGGLFPPKELFGNALVNPTAELKVTVEPDAVKISGMTNQQNGLGFSLPLMEALGFMINL